MPRLPQAVSGIVFDCDGLLLDTETCWSRAEAALLTRYGHPFGERERALLVGLTLEDICTAIARLVGLDGPGTRLQNELVSLVETELGDQVAPMSGAHELVSTLAQRAPLAVASNSSRSMLDSVLESADMARYFTVTVAADEVCAPKPHPESYLTAFALLGASPCHGVAFEDSATGVAAARAAGPFLVTVPSDVGSRLDGDFVTSSLGDPRLHRWARSVETR